MYDFSHFGKHNRQRGNGSPVGAHRQVRRVRLRLELLEDRLVPSLFATANNGSELISINPTTGSATVIGSYPPGGGNAAYEDAFTPDGTLWTFIGNAPSQQLAKVDTTTATLTPVGFPTTIGGLIRGL